MSFIIHLTKAIEGITPRVNHSVNDGLWVIMTHPCRFIDDNKGTALVEDVDNTGGCA